MGATTIRREFCSVEALWDERGWIEVSVVFGARVLQARVLRSLPSGVVAERVGWRPERLSRLERRDRVEVDDADVAKLREVLRVSEAFLTTAPVAHVDERSLSFRAPASMTQRERKYLTQFAALVEEFIDRVTRVNPLPPVRLPRLRPGGSIVAAAAAAREAMGISDGPIGSLTMAMERAGIPVVMRSAASVGSISGEADMSERHIGLSAWLGEFADQPLVMMPALSSWERTRWTLAHELGHICLHRGGVTGAEVEDEAHAFAGEFLAPISQVAPELPAQVTLTALIDVKVRWGVSIGALIMHLSRHHVIDAERTRTLQRQLYTRKNPDTGRSWGVDEPAADVRTAERPRLLMKWLERSTGSQSPQMFAALPEVVLPPDLVAAVLANQRLGRSAQTAPAADAAVWLFVAGPDAGFEADIKAAADQGDGLAKVVPLSRRR